MRPRLLPVLALDHPSFYANKFDGRKELMESQALPQPLCVASPHCCFAAGWASHWPLNGPVALFRRYRPAVAMYRTGLF